MDNYNYTLTYTCGNVELIFKFPADVDIYQLGDYLKDFLKGCSWYESTLNKIFKDDEEICKEQ